jgi:hypothetical protein
MAADGHGHVYAIGDWWTIPGDLGSSRYKWRGKDTYQQLDRGEFFAVANVRIGGPATTDLPAPGTAPGQTR